MSAPFVSVVVPAYNEARCIEANLKKMADYLGANFSLFEVIVVDDGSADGTVESVAEIARKEPRVRLVPFPANRGKGFAVRQGMRQAKGEIALFTDADLSTPLEEIQRAAAEVAAGFPVVMASRRHPDSAIVVRQGWLREKIGRGFNLFVRLLLPLKFTDTQCGFKCFSRKAAADIFSLALIDGFAFDVEVLLIAGRLGYPVKEIPVYWTDAPDTKVRPARHFSQIARDLLKIYWNDRRGLYRPQRVGLKRAS